MNWLAKQMRRNVRQVRLMPDWMREGEKGVGPFPAVIAEIEEEISFFQRVGCKVPREFRDAIAVLKQYKGE